MIATPVVGRAPSRLIRTILLAGLIAGSLDITAAFIVYAPSGPGSIRLLQYIASGLIGKAALDGGLATALLGLVCPFFIATSWAALYVAASRRSGFLLAHPIVSGTGYGLIIYAVMNHLIVPLSAIGPRPFSLSAAIVAAVILVFCVGVPLALIARRGAPLLLCQPPTRRFPGAASRPTTDALLI